MATMTQTLRDTKGATYAAALATWLAALVDLAACEQLIPQNVRGFPALGDTVDLRSLAHPAYVSVVSATSLTDLIAAQVAVLQAS